MRLYFVRHAQSVGNADGYFSTVNHDQLSPLGLEQAEALAVRLEGLAFDEIYVSPTQRTLQTLAPYLREQERQAQVWPDLAEGCWQSDMEAPIPVREGLAELITVPPELAARYRVGEDRCRHPWGEETYKEGVVRSVAAGEELLKRHGGTADCVLVVGHLNSGCCMLELLLEMALSKSFTYDNTGLSCLQQREDGTFLVEFMNRL